MSATEAEPADEAERRRRSQARRRDRTSAHVLAGLSAVGAALSGAAPTGTAGVDIVLTAAFAGIVTLAAGRARRSPVLALPLASIAVASGWWIVVALTSIAPAVAGAGRARRERRWGAATAAIALQPLLRGDIGFHGLPSLIAAAAVAPVLVSAYGRCRRRERRNIRRIAYGLIGATAVVGVAYGAVVISVAGDVDSAASEARRGLAETRQGETDAARASFRRAEGGFGRANARLNAWWAAPARAVPVLAQHARALGGAASEGGRLAESAAATVEAADYQQLRYSSGRFDLERIASVKEPLSDTLAAMTTARTALDANDSPWLLGPLADALDELDSEVAEAEDEAELASQAIEVAPALLGGDGPRRYFVAFVTPAELRGSGGFMGSWAEITAEDGRLRLAESGPVRELGQNTPADGITITGPEEYLNRFGQYVGGPRFIGDFGYSPHFPHSAEVMAQMYPQVGGDRLDGVISIDPIALAALLEFTGPLEVAGFGQTVDADNAAEFLLRDNYAQFPDNESQNDALAELVELTFDELTTGDLPGPRRISEVLAPATRAGRIRLWSPLAAEEALFSRFGATGAFPDARPDHDFFALSSQNSGNNKIDVFQSRAVDYDVSLDGDGGVEANARITVRNDPPLDGSVPDYVIGNSQGDPPGTNRMLISVHTPHSLRTATLDGEPIGTEPEVEAGYRIYTFRVAVPPGEEVTLDLDLFGTLDLDGGRYVLDLAPQPTANSDVLAVTLDRGDGELASVGPLDVLGRRQVVLRP